MCTWCLCCWEINHSSLSKGVDGGGGGGGGLARRGCPIFSSSMKLMLNRTQIILCALSQFVTILLLVESLADLRFLPG